MKKTEKVTVIVFTDRAKAVGGEAARILESGGYAPEILDGREVKISAEMEKIFSDSRFIVFVSAVGIAVRLIAPFVRAKDRDPGIVAADEGKNFVISLLSGHLGGANQLAEMLADGLGAVPVITTATDVNEKFAVDVWTKGAGCVIENTCAIKYISSAVLKDEKVGLYTEFETEGELPAGLERAGEGRTGICVDFSGKRAPFDVTLNAVPKILSIGAGCRKGTDPEKFERFFRRVLDEEGISPLAVESISSIDLKKDEECMTGLAEKLEVPFITYSAEHLDGAGKADSCGYEFDESDFVRRTTGTGNVCERSAFLSSGRGKIIVKKRSEGGMTLAVAMRDWKCRF